MEGFIANRLDYPILTVTTFLPLAGVLAILAVRSARSIRWLALVTTIATFLVSLPVYVHFDKTTHMMQFVERYSWLPAWNLDYAVGVDGISVPFIMLSTIISVLCVLVSWKSISEKVKGFYIMLLLMETIMIGIFVSLNLLLFFIFWEAMLIPMFLLIGVWGGQNRVFASIKFLLYTLSGSIFMLVGIIALYFISGKTFDMVTLSTLHLPLKTQVWLFLAFFVAFAVKVPLVPLHSWLPDAYTEAPTAATVILAAVLAKMGAYGILRMPLAMFPDAANMFLQPLIALSVITIIYGAYVALAQEDFKRLIAYSSISHMGFITLGIFALNQAGVEGGILQMVNHGIVISALFLCAGVIYERTHTGAIEDYGGLAKAVPLFVICFTVFALAGSGFPGMNYFIGEFLVLSGAFKTSLTFASISILGLILGVTYMAWLYYRIVLKKVNIKINSSLYDLDLREMLMFAPLVILVFYIGVQPQAAISYMQASVQHLLERFGASGQEITAVKGIIEVLK